jgi:O-6-methylguanine DNA methyltransferase
MNHQDQISLAAARRLLGDLRTLREAGAPYLLPGVAEQLGPGDRYAPFDTPIGPLFVAYNAAGISAIRRAGDAAGFERNFRARFRRPIQPADALPAALQAALEARLAGDADATLSFDLASLRPFERAVLLKAIEIPRGEVRSYAWIAREIGHPRAVRAVGTALAANPIPLVIPCHRVVRSDYRLGEYIFGAAVKRAVLDDEGAGTAVLEDLARHGVRFLGDPDDGSYCLPSCGGMHLRANQHYLQLHTVAEAQAVGLRPCSSCRPSASS